MKARVAVVGSANLDIVLSVNRFPRGGETILGQRLEEVAGGKGLNQAIAAGRNVDCAFVGCIGDDEAGVHLTAELDGAGVNRAHVRRGDAATGRAFIQVTPDGENSIVVMPLANQRLTAADVRVALEALQPSVALAQLEIPLDAVAAAAAVAATSGARFVLNASPAQPLPAFLLNLCDPVIVNVGEAELLLGDSAPARDALTERHAYVHDLAQRLATRVRSLAVTDGPHGVHVGTADAVTHLPGEVVAPVDTTGAGDTFAGTLAAALAHGVDLVAAATLANRAAARIVQVPRRDRVERNRSREE